MWNQVLDRPGTNRGKFSIISHIVFELLCCVFIYWDFCITEYKKTSSSGTLLLKIILLSQTFYVNIYLFYCLVVDLACMESTACQTCVKRSPSPWSATWSVPILSLDILHIVCLLVCFVLSFVSISFYLLNHHRSYSCAFNVRIWDEIVIRQILNQNANFSLPPLLNLKLFPTTLECIHSSWSGYGKL